MWRVWRSLHRPPRRALYRARQFERALHPALTPEEAAAVSERLRPAELRLFLQMQPQDRRHAVDVLRWLERHAQPPPAHDLLVAALLHDVGKGPVRTRDRVLFVLLEALTPRFVGRLAAERARAHWRRSLWALRYHARRGAELLRTLGATPAVVELVARHTEPPPPGGTHAADPAAAALAWLIAADRAC